MAPPVAGRRLQVAKPCHMDPLSIWPIVRGGPPFGTAPTHEATGRGSFIIAWLRFRRGRPKGVPLWEFRKMQVVGALMGRAVRRPQVAKPCHMDPLSIWPIGRYKNPSVSFADSSPSQVSHSPPL